MFESARLEPAWILATSHGGAQDVEIRPGKRAIRKRQSSDSNIQVFEDRRLRQRQLSGRQNLLGEPDVSSRSYIVQE
jgi:hypothetical protein